MTPKGDQHDIEMEWERRTLCSDESCIGVIGADGRCGICGQPHDGPLPEPTAASDTAAFVSTPSDNGHDPGPDEAPASQAGDPEDSVNRSPADDDWANRRLCSDESCIGVIGANGRCRECGLPYEGS